VLSGVDAVEALSLVLIQYDRTFAWEEAAAQVRLVPAPLHPTISQEFSLGSRTVDELRDALAQSAPGAVATSIDEATVEVRGLIEEVEQARELLAGGPRRRPAAVPATPLRQRRFSLEAQQVTAAAALQALRQQGVDVRYDEAALRAAGVDLQTRINLELRRASADEFLLAVCGPLGLEYRIAEDVIELWPEEAAAE
jgi:hypothetical protein